MCCKKNLLPALVLRPSVKMTCLPEKRGTQSVTAHRTVNVYSYSFRYPVRDKDGLLAYGRCGVVLRIQNLWGRQGESSTT